MSVHCVRKCSDELGEELPDDEAAWEEATIIAAEQFRDIDGRLQPGQQWTLEVTAMRVSHLHHRHQCKRFEVTVIGMTCFRVLRCAHQQTGSSIRLSPHRQGNR
jgi:hypothetical protein